MQFRSEFHFHRVFKAFKGESIGAHISRLRIEAAARLLRYSALSIEDIAFNIGYEAPAALSKAFKNQYGITPTQYRTNKDIYIMKKEIANFRPMSFLIIVPQKRDALNSFESLCRYPYGPSLSYRPISPTPLLENVRRNPPSHRAQQERKTPG